MQSWVKPGQQITQSAPGVIPQQPHAAPAEQMEHRSSPELQLMLCWVSKIPSVGGKTDTHPPAEPTSLPSSEQALFRVPAGWRDGGMAAGSSSLDACYLRAADFGMWLTEQEGPRAPTTRAPWFSWDFPCTTGISLALPTFPLQYQHFPHRIMSEDCFQSVEPPGMPFPILQAPLSAFLFPQHIGPSNTQQSCNEIFLP